VQIKTFIKVFIENPYSNWAMSAASFFEWFGVDSSEAFVPSNNNIILSYIDAITVDLAVSSPDSDGATGSSGFKWNVKYPPIMNTTAAVVRMHAPFLKVNFETSFYINIESTIHDQRSEHTRIIQ